jgi:hypothetical protein
MKPDIIIEMEFDMVNSKVQIRTNAKRDKVGDLLEDYLHAQVGTGKDPSPPAERDIYKISIGVELGEDIWGSSHDCGNKGLREGIIMRVLQMLDSEPDRVTYVD